jgi:hypothetical protein
MVKNIAQQRLSVAQTPGVPFFSGKNYLGGLLIRCLNSVRYFQLPMLPSLSQGSGSSFVSFPERGQLC